MNPDPDEHVHPGEEELQWGQGVKEKNREKKPSSRYSAISEQARKMIPGESQCKMFCGGKTCKYCTAENWTKEQMVISGLYSEWVTDNIIAMARMSNENIAKYNMVEQLQDLKVKTIINLQQPGEHAYCGSGNDESGFSYNPQTFMAAQFFFYNFAMEDYGVAPMARLLDMVKVMQFAVSQGKVAVHCHAGLGRTGLVIACYLIYNNRVKAHKAIHYVRSRRPGAIQTRQQMKTCYEFEQYLKLYYIVFTSKIADSHAVSFNRFLTRQRQLLHGYEARKLKHIPKVVYVCCERLLELCGRGRALSSLRNQPVDPIPAELESLSSRSNARLSSPSLFDDQAVNSPLLNRSFDTSDSGHSLLRESRSTSRLNDLREGEGKKKASKTLSVPSNLRNSGKSLSPTVIRRFPGSANDISDGSIEDLSKEIRRYDIEDEDCNVDNDDDDDNDDDSIVYGQRDRSNSGGDSLCGEAMSVGDVCEPAIVSEYSPDILEALNKLESQLNEKDQAWRDLACNRDPLMIWGILCDWLDQLSGPVLTGQDIYTLVENADNPERALMRLEKSTKYLLEYVLLVVSKLEPVPERTLHGVLEFFLSYLCQKKLNLGYISFSSRQAHFGDLKADTASLLFKVFLQLLHEEKKKARMG